MNDICGPYPLEVQRQIDAMVALGLLRDDIYVREDHTVYHDPMSSATECLLSGHFYGFDAYLNAHPLRLGFTGSAAPPEPPLHPSRVERPSKPFFLRWSDPEPEREPSVFERINSWLARTAGH